MAVLLAASAQTDTPSKAASKRETSPTESNASDTGNSPGFDYRSVVFTDLLDTGKKLLETAQATPPDKFTWRPPNADRAYSVSELYLLAASLYYHMPYEFGAIRAAGYEFEGDDVTGGRGTAIPFEKSTTEKRAVLLELTDSLAYFKNIMPTLSEADLQEPIELDGRRTTPNAGLFLMATDLHNYLAQAVVYARLNGIVLPWMNTDDERREKQGQRKPAR